MSATKPRRRRMPIADTFWLWLESPTTAMQVACLTTFSAGPETREVVAEIVDEFRGQQATTRPFNTLIHQRPAPLMSLREPTDDVEIDYHFRHSALPAPGGQRELGVLVSRLHSMPLDIRRPLWESHVIEGVGEDEFAVYLKAHHSLMDGVAGVRAITETFSSEPDQPLKPAPWAREIPQRPQRDAPTRESLVLRGRSALGNLRQVNRALRQFGQASLQSKNPLVGPFQAPRSPLNVTISPQRRFSTATIELARAARLAELTGTTLNDVVLAACSTALRRYLLAHDGLPDKPLVAMCPVSIRPADSDGDGNAVSMILADLATDEADPRERLTRIAASTTAGKEHLRRLPKAALAAYSALAMGPHLLRQLVPGALRVRPSFNLVISNVPGPRRPLYAGRARMTGFFPMSLLFRNEALNITVLSYDGQLNFGFTACRRSLPQAQDIAVFTSEAFDELEALVTGSAGASE